MKSGMLMKEETKNRIWTGLKWLGYVLLALLIIALIRGSSFGQTTDTQPVQQNDFVVSHQGELQIEKVQTSGRKCEDYICGTASIGLDAGFFEFTFYEEEVCLYTVCSYSPFGGKDNINYASLFGEEAKITPCLT